MRRRLLPIGSWVQTKLRWTGFHISRPALPSSRDPSASRGRTPTLALLACLLSGILACSGLTALQPLPEAPPPSLLAPTDAQDLSETLEPLRAAKGVPALAALVLRGGDIVAIGATGTDRVHGDTPATVDESWHIGSNGKAMTATLLARLVVRGDLAWDSKLGHVLADLDPHPAWREATLEQLLAHTSGLQDNPSRSQMLRLLFTSAPPHEARRTLLKEALAEPPVHPPGSAFLYSNYGYIAAGAMAEAITGKPYEELVVAEVFEPLGVVDFGFGPPPPPSPLGHIGDELKPMDPLPVADNPRAFSPAGAMHFTLTSWSRFVQAHLEGHHGARTDYLPPEVWQRLHQPHLDHYALGWGVRESPSLGETAWTHAGSNTMHMAQVLVVPAWDLAVLVSSNCGNDACSDAVSETIKALAEAWRPPAE